MSFDSQCDNDEDDDNDHIAINLVRLLGPPGAEKPNIQHLAVAATSNIWELKNPTSNIHSSLGKNPGNTVVVRNKIM